MKQAKKIDLKKLLSFLGKAKRILIATHVNPDGDGLGSILALGEALRKKNKKVTLYCQDAMPQMYRYLPGWKKIQNTLPENAQYDLSLILDLGEIERVGDAFRNHSGRGITISIDHHARGMHNADYNFCLPRQASSGEVVFKVIKALKIKITKSMAMAIYTAMVTDTGSFKYSNTTQETFAIAAELMREKIPVWTVAKNCFETMSAERLILLKRVLSSLQIHESKKISWIVVRQSDFSETGARSDDTEGFINYPRSIDTVEVAVSFREVNSQKWKVSFRSKDYYDVGGFAEKFGGGGHVRASGATLEGSFTEVEQKIISGIAESI